MALKDEKGNYLRVGRLEGVDIRSKTAFIRIYQHDTEAGRQAAPFEPDKNFCVQEVSLTDEQIKTIQDLCYASIKDHKVRAGENEDGPIYETPFSDYTDC